MAAAVLGLVNGLVIAKARIQPFVVTLAMLIAARGAALAVTAEQSIPVDRAATGITWLGRGVIGPIPVPVVICALAYALGWIVLRYTRFGRYVYAVGDNEEAARLMGLKADRVVVRTYVLSGALAGLAGVILAARLGAGQPVAAMGCGAHEHRGSARARDARVRRAAWCAGGIHRAWAGPGEPHR
jgi:ribose transport system permease protein